MQVTVRINGHLQVVALKKVVLENEAIIAYDFDNDKMIIRGLSNSELRKLIRDLEIVGHANWSSLCIEEEF